MVINLTTSPQSIIGSDNGIFIYPNEFMYAFGSVEPTVGTQWDFDRSKPFKYGGEHGLLWVWIDGTDAQSLPYSLANTPPKVALTDSIGNTLNSFNGALNIHDADVHHSIVNDFFHQHTATTTTFAANAPAGSTQITLTSATGFTVGDFLHIQDGVIETVHPRITVLAGTLATLDRPLDNPYVIGDTITKTLRSMDVLGTILAPQSFKAHPLITEIWHIEAITIELTHGTAGDNGVFGNLTALTNGVILRLHNGLTGQNTTFTNWKTNSGILLDTGNIDYSTRSGGGGAYGTNSIGNFRINTGSVVYVDGTRGDYLEILIQDDLTALDSFRVKVQGHIEGY